MDLQLNERNDETYPSDSGNIEDQSPSETASLSPIAKEIQRRLIAKRSAHAEYNMAAAEVAWLEISGKPSDSLKRDVNAAIVQMAQDIIIENWRRNQEAQETGKRAAYLSIEYLLGTQTRALLHSAKIYGSICAGLEELGFDAQDIINHEREPALGNGGLGRLAACLMTSTATLGVPAIGYGIRYELGLFRQAFDTHGKQLVLPDRWEEDGPSPHLFPREVPYVVKFFGNCSEGKWNEAVTVPVQAFDAMVPGRDPDKNADPMINTLRLWAVDSETVDDETRNQYIKQISKRLYPSDGRLEQEYFLVSASLQDMIARHLKQHDTLANLAETTAIQLNDTHPVLAIPELMRLLVDGPDEETKNAGLNWERVDWEEAKRIVSEVCFYTNHTKAPEALEEWPVSALGELLPRQMEIIRRLDQDVKAKAESREDFRHRAGEVALIVTKEDKKEYIRMAHMAVAYALTNGVSPMHSDIIRDEVFGGFRDLNGSSRFGNVTNGIDHWRWLHDANPGLTRAISDAVGHDEWLRNPERLYEELKGSGNDPAFHERLAAVRQERKERLFEAIARHPQMHGLRIAPDAMVTAMIKRFHEYKRQLLSLIHTWELYQERLAEPNVERPNIVEIMAGKAFPGYAKAEKAVHFANWMSWVINEQQPVRDGSLKLVVPPNYNVSWAERIIPATYLNKQSPLASWEAAGTSNMKFAINGSPAIMTLDGANVDIAKAAGEENVFLFGLRSHEVKLYGENENYHPLAFLNGDERLKHTLTTLHDHMLKCGSPEFVDLIGDLREGRDPWMILVDYAGYREQFQRATEVGMDPGALGTITVANIRAGSLFSSDRSIGNYARIWGIEPQRESPTTGYKFAPEVSLIRPVPAPPAASRFLEMAAG